MSASSRINVISSELLSHRWAKLEMVHFDYQRNNGVWQRHVREIYDRGHGAAILLYNLEHRSVILIKQFRYPVFSEEGDGFILEVPAGVLEQNNPELTVRAETEQETGYAIGELSFLFAAYASPGSVTEKLHYFCAPYQPDQKTGSGGGIEEEGEEIEVLELPFDEAYRWVGEGKITDAKTIILLQYAALNLFSTI